MESRSEMDPKVKEVFINTLMFNARLVKMTLGDFSDADMLVRPVPSANHATWQLGHMLASETRMINGMKPGAGAALPDGFLERFNGKTTSVDDPARLATKAQLLELLDKVRAASIQFVQALTIDDLPKPGPEQIRQLAPTVGDVVQLIPNHASMHIGQIQVIRRRLGKPVLF